LVSALMPLLLLCDGCKLVDQTTFGAKPVAPSPDQMTEALKTGSRLPLVIIRFDNGAIDETAGLRTAVNLAEARKPNAEYDVVTIVPARLSPDQQIATAERTQRDATDVMDTLADLGVSPDHISLGVRTDPAASGREIRIYVH
jgi:hypothetical protein